MTASRSPRFIRSRRSASLPSARSTFGADAKAARSCADAALRSRSAHPTSRRLAPPPAKIDPNRTTKTSGKARVQKRADRSRTKLRMLAMVSWNRARIRLSTSVAQSPAGEIQEDVLQCRPPNRQVVRLLAERLGRVEDRPDRGRHVLAVEQGLTVFVLDRRDPGKPR